MKENLILIVLTLITDVAWAEYKLTPAEKKVVEEAKKHFKEGKNLPPPSQHMQNKMQSSVSDVTEEDLRKEEVEQGKKAKKK